MPTVPTELPEQVRRGLAQIGLDDAALALISAGDDLVESEKAFRQRGRLGAVRADAARVSALAEREDRFNAAGIRQLNRAADLFDHARSGLSADARGKIKDALGTQEFRDRLDEVRATFHDHIVRAEISGGEAEEIVEMWEEAQKVLEQEGFDGLLNHARDRAREAREVRERPNRGREAHSPLSWWKYAIIAGAIAVGVASIIACFIWGACAWVVAMVGFLGGAASGWIIEMIRNGCAPIPLAET